MANQNKVDLDRRNLLATDIEKKKVSAGIQKNELLSEIEKEKQIGLKDKAAMAKHANTATGLHPAVHPPTATATATRPVATRIVRPAAPPVAQPTVATTNVAQPTAAATTVRPAAVAPTVAPQPTTVAPPVAASTQAAAPAKISSGPTAAATAPMPSHATLPPPATNESSVATARHETGTASGSNVASVVHAPSASNVEPSGVPAPANAAVVNETAVAPTGDSGGIPLANASSAPHSSGTGTPGSIRGLKNASPASITALEGSGGESQLKKLELEAFDADNALKNKAKSAGESSPVTKERRQEEMLRQAQYVTSLKRTAEALQKLDCHTETANKRRDATVKELIQLAQRSQGDLLPMSAIMTSRDDMTKREVKFILPSDTEKQPATLFDGICNFFRGFLSPSVPVNTTGQQEPGKSGDKNGDIDRLREETRNAQSKIQALEAQYQLIQEQMKQQQRPIYSPWSSSDEEMRQRHLMTLSSNESINRGCRCETVTHRAPERETGLVNVRVLFNDDEEEEQEPTKNTVRVKVNGTEVPILREKRRKQETSPCFTLCSYFSNLCKPPESKPDEIRSLCSSCGSSTWDPLNEVYKRKKTSFSDEDDDSDEIIEEYLVEGSSGYERLFSGGARDKIVSYGQGIVKSHPDKNVSHATVQTSSHHTRCPSEYRRPSNIGVRRRSSVHRLLPRRQSSFDETHLPSQQQQHFIENRKTSREIISMEVLDRKTALDYIEKTAKAVADEFRNRNVHPQGPSPLPGLWVAPVYQPPCCFGHHPQYGHGHGGHLQDEVAQLRKPSGTRDREERKCSKEHVVQKVPIQEHHNYPDPYPDSAGDGSPGLDVLNRQVHRRLCWTPIYYDGSDSSPLKTDAQRQSQSFYNKRFPSTGFYDSSPPLVFGRSNINLPSDENTEQEIVTPEDKAMASDIDQKEQQSGEKKDGESDEEKGKNVEVPVDFFDLESQQIIFYPEQSLVFAAICCCIVWIILVFFLSWLKHYSLQSWLITRASSPQTTNFFDQSPSTDIDTSTTTTSQTISRSRRTTKRTHSQITTTESPTTTESEDKVYVCNHPYCLAEARRLRNIFHRPEVDPCDNFYDFVCDRQQYRTKHIEGVAVNKDGEIQRVIADLIAQQLENLRRNDVRIARILYTDCVRTASAEIDRDDVAQVLGYLDRTPLKGWPFPRGHVFSPLVIEHTIAKLALDWNCEPIIRISAEPDSNNNSNYLLALDEPIHLIHRANQNFKSIQSDIMYSMEEIIRMFRVSSSSMHNAAADVIEASKIIATMAAPSFQRLLGVEAHRVVTTSQLAPFLRELIAFFEKPSILKKNITRVLLKSPTYLKRFPEYAKRVREFMNFLGFSLILKLTPIFRADHNPNMRRIYWRQWAPQVALNSTVEHFCLRLVDQTIPLVMLKALMSHFRAASREFDSLTTFRIALSQLESLFIHHTGNLDWFFHSQYYEQNHQVLISKMKKLQVAALYPSWILIPNKWNVYNTLLESVTAGHPAGILRFKGLLSFNKQEKLSLITARPGVSPSFRRHVIDLSSFAVEPVFDVARTFVAIPIGVFDLLNVWEKIPPSPVFFLTTVRYAVRVWMSFSQIFFDSLVYPMYLEDNTLLVFGGDYNQREEVIEACLFDGFNAAPRTIRDPSGFRMDKRVISRMLFVMSMAIAQIYNALDQLSTSKRLWKKDFRLKGLENVSTAMLFFTQYAIEQCEQADALAQNNAYAERGLLPAQDRVNGPLRNLPQFFKAFNCKPDAPMRASNEQLCPILIQQ